MLLVTQPPHSDPKGPRRRLQPQREQFARYVLWCILRDAEQQHCRKRDTAAKRPRNTNWKNDKSFISYNKR